MSASMNWTKALRRIGAVVTLLTVCHPVSAATSTGALAVSASVTGVCIIGNATLAFGPYDPTAAAAITANTTVSLTCSLGTLFNIGMNVGVGVGATTTLRVMTSSSGTLGYGLFSDPGFTINWGNTLGVNTLTGTSSLTTLLNNINIYGRIPAGQPAAAGNYADTVTMTVTY